MKNTQIISHQLTLGDILQGYRLWPERTLTSPTGCHLGHHKAWLTSPDTSFLPEPLQRGPHLTNEGFLEIICLKLSLCISLHHPLRRWSRVHIMLTPKDKTYSPEIERIRMINQIDNELNLLRRILIAHRVMSNAEDSGLLSEDQWGGRSGKQCIDLALHNEILLHSLHLARKNAVMTDVDATSCFDCIPPSLMYLAYARAGATFPTIDLLGKALLRLR